MEGDTVAQSWYQFDRPAKEWIEIDPASAATTKASVAASASDDGKFTLATWNVDAFEARPQERISALVDHIRSLTPPDIIFLQELSGAALIKLLTIPWICESYYVTPGAVNSWLELNLSSFTTATLISKTRFGGPVCLGLVWRVFYESRYGRDALCCDVHFPPPATSTPMTATSTPASASPGTAVASAPTPPSAAEARAVIRLINVHLDSLAHRPSFRPDQLAITATSLRQVGRGLVAGDFNPVLPEDSTLVAANGLVDAWTTLHPEEPGFTWGIDGKAPFPPRRMDKIAMLGLEASHMEVMIPGTLEPEPVTSQKEQKVSGVESRRRQGRSGPLPWSDHCGLLCTFSVAESGS